MSIQCMCHRRNRLALKDLAEPIVRIVVPAQLTQSIACKLCEPWRSRVRSKLVDVGYRFGVSAGFPVNVRTPSTSKGVIAALNGFVVGPKRSVDLANHLKAMAGDAKLPRCAGAHPKDLLKVVVGLFVFSEDIPTECVAS